MAPVQSTTNKPLMVSNPGVVRRYPPLAEDTTRLVMRYALQDYAVDRGDGQYKHVETVVPLSDRFHYRWDMVGSYGGGRAEFCGLANGFYVIFGDIEYLMPESAYLSSPDALQVYVASSGDGEYVLSGSGPLSVTAPNMAIILEPAGGEAAEITLSGRVRYIHVSIHREALKTLYAGGEDELPAMLQTFLAGDLAQSVALSLPMAGEMLRCLDSVHACALEGRRRRLFLQSKSVEILCHALEAIEHADGFESPETTRLMARGVLKAQQILNENFVDPPSLENLAHVVGLSRSGLCAGFRVILGQSVFDYIQDLRMQHALVMLNSHNTSISEIAYAVGYNHPSSFSAAVQRRFGATPTELRRRGTLPRT